MGVFRINDKVWSAPSTLIETKIFQSSNPGAHSVGHPWIGCPVVDTGGRDMGMVVTYCSFGYNGYGVVPQGMRRCQHFYWLYYRLWRCSGYGTLLSLCFALSIVTYPYGNATRV